MAIKKKLATRKTTEMTNWEEDMKADAAEAAKVEVSEGGGAISCRSGILSWMGEAMPNNSMDVVIIGSVGEHTYYDSPYDSDNIAPPTCFSVYGLIEDPAPHADVPEDQQQAERCKLCWAHRFGSATTGSGKGRECKVRRRLLCMPAAGVEDPTQADVAVMKISPTSVQNWTKYVQLLAAQNQRPPHMVVTRITVTPHPKWQFEVNFEVVSLIDGSRYTEMSSKVEVGTTELRQPFDMSPREDATPAPTKRLKSDRRVTKKKARVRK